MSGARSCLSRLFMLGCCAAFALMLISTSAQAQLSAVPGNWTQLSPATMPPGRTQAGIAYDQATGDTVLFGGAGDSDYLNDTWTWDGTRWTQRSPANSPSARMVAGMAYDAARAKVVLFSGAGNLGYAGDTWTWDGTTWTQLSPVNSPPARISASMVYDAARGKVVLFGGFGTSTSLNDTWTWDGTNWTQLSPVSSPSARDGASMVYDPATGNVVLFGGRDSGFNYLNDTWIWDGTTWTQISPTVTPPVRAFAPFVYDAPTGKAVLFGGTYAGLAGSFSNDTWSWDGANWRGVTPAISPAARTQGNMFYDPATGSVLLLNGQGSGAAFTDLWRFTTGQDLGTVNVGATATSTITLTFTGSGTATLAAPAVLTMGAPNLDFTDAGTGTCTTNGTSHSYAAGDSCTVDVVFTPKFAGARHGAVVLQDNSSNVIATAYIHGAGQGPQVVFRPTASYAPTVLGGGFINTTNATVDGGGNVYVVDNGVNKLYKIPAGCTSSACVTAIGGGFNSLQPIAVDGSGNIYVGEATSNLVKKVPADCASSSCVTTLGGGFSIPAGIAIDDNGSIYVSDASPTIKKMPADCTSSACITKLGGGFSTPAGLAVDGNGTVYAASIGSNSIKKSPSDCFSSSCVTTVGGGFSHPVGVSLDAAGNIYVADTSNGVIKKMPSGCTSSSCVITLASGFSLPRSVSLDGNGNIYIADLGARKVEEIVATPPTLTFATTVAGNTSADSPQTVTIENIGNLPLSFPPPLTGNNPSMASAPDFNLNSTGTTKCPLISSSSSAGSLSAGATCDLTVSFAPLVTPPFGGAVSESLLLADNTLNASAPAYATQSLTLKGTVQATAPYFTVTGYDPVPFYTATGIVITAHHADGTVDTGYNGTISFASSDPGFVNLCADTLTNGVETCNVAFKTAGTLTVTVSDPASGFLPGTYTTTMPPGAVTHFDVSAPTSEIVGTPISVTVTAGDLFNNVVTGYTGTVHFTSTATSAVLPSDYTFVAGDHGTRTFSATLKTPGNQTISVADVATPTSSGISSTIAVANPKLVVTTNADGTANAAHCTAQATAGSGTDTSCSLRDALAYATAAGGGDVSFDATTFAAATTINLTSGTLTLSSNTSIQGATSGSGATVKNLVMVSGGSPSSNFTVINATGTNSSLANLILTRGNGSNGGAINNSGTLTVKQCTLMLNAAANGGGIYNSGTLTLDGSTLSGNSAAVAGGGIASSGPLTVLSSTISGNATLGSVVAFGGGIHSSASLVIKQSTISNNIAAANNLGGLAQGAGIYLASGTLALSNSIVAANTFASIGLSADISGNYTDGGGNQASNNPAPISTLSLLNLSALGNYGGPVQTIVPLPGSPAICAATASNIPTGVTTDQRGYPRTTTYGSTSCVDSGSTQTNFAIAFAQQPSNVVQNAAMSPAPTVTLTDNGAAFTPTVTIPLTLTGSGTLSGASAATSSGTAIYSSLKVDTAGTDDKLTAKLGVNSSATLFVSATSDPFDVTSAVSQLIFGTAPATPVALGGNAGASVTVKEADSSGTTVATASDTVTLAVTGPNSYSQSYTATAVSGVATFNLSAVPLNNAGDYTYKAILGSNSVTAAETVNKGTATITLRSLSATYDGNSHAATATTSPAGLTVAFTYGGSSTAPTAAGSYAVLATVNDANYQGTQAGTLVIDKTTPTITWSAPSAITYGTALSNTQLNAKANANGSFAYTPAAGTMLSAGANQALSVNFTPTDTTNYNTASKSVLLTVNRQGATLALSVSATAITPLQTVTFTALVAPVANGTPSGSVTFFDGTTTLQTVALTGNSASYTTGLLSGSHTISATYNGDTNYLTATAASSVGVTVAPLDFTLTQQGANYQTVVPGASAEFTYLISPTYGTYPGTVTLNVTGLPPGATYTLSQGSISATGGVKQFTLSIKTAASTAVNHASRTPWTLAFLLLPLAGATQMRKRSRKIAQSLLIAVIALAGIASLTGCGSSNGFLAHAPQDYNVTVTATSGGVVHTSTVTLNVQ